MGFGALTSVLANRSASLTIKGQRFDTESVIKAEDMARGLSGRESLDRNKAMVFKYPKVEQRCFWMKDMKFAIDIVWLDAGRKVTAIERNVQPSSYPESFCHDGQTIVEFAAGTAERLPLYTGDIVK